MVQVELDALDRNILSILQDDARMPFTKIAEKVGVSDATIHLRVRKIEAMGLIERYTVVINEATIGVPVTTYVLIRVDPGTVEEVCMQLAKLEETYDICEIHERYDLLVKVRSSSLEGVRDILIQKIRSIPHVVGSEAYTVYKTWKRDFGIRIEGSDATMRREG